MLHALRDLDVLDLDGRDLDAPWLGLVVDYLLKLLVEALAFGEQRVEIRLAEHRAQRGLSDLRCGCLDVFDLDYGSRRIDDAVVHDRGHAGRDVVARDDVLRRHLERDGAQADPDHAVDGGQQQDQPRAALIGDASESEDDAALVLAEDANRRACQREQRDDDADEDDDGRKDHVISSHSSARRTDSVSPFTRSTTMRSPSRRPSSSLGSQSCRARHSAPSTKTCPAG